MGQSGVEGLEGATECGEGSHVYIERGLFIGP